MPMDFLCKKYNCCAMNPVTGGGTNELYTISRNNETILVESAGICSIGQTVPASSEYFL